MALASARSSLDQGFLLACQPMDATAKRGSGNIPPARSPSSQRGRQGSPESSRSNIPPAGAVASSDEIMVELKRVAHMSSETANAVDVMIKQMGSLHDLLQETLKQSVASSNSRPDIDDLAALNAQLNAQLNSQLNAQLGVQVQQALSGHFDDLGQHIDTSMNRHMGELTQQLKEKQQQQPEPQQLAEMPAGMSAVAEPRGESMDANGEDSQRLEVQTPSGAPKTPKYRDVFEQMLDSEAVLATQSSTDKLGQNDAWCYNRIVTPASLCLVFLDFAFFIAGQQVTHEHLARQPAEQPPSWVLDGDIVFVVCFVLDILLRTVVTRRWRNPYGTGAGRLYFDSTVTVLGVLDVILRASDAHIQIAGLRFLRFFRIIRLVRIARAMQTLGQRSRWILEVLLFLESMARSMLPLATIVVVLFLLGLLLAMCLSSMIAATLSSGQDFTDTDLMALYGSLWHTYFTLYTAITDGADWRQLLLPLEKLNWWYSIAFSLFIAFVKFGALNFVSAVVFVNVLRHRDTLLMRESFMNQERDQATLDELRQLFRSSGKEREGRITEKTCRKVLEGEGAMHLNALGLTFAKVMGLFRMLEKDNEGRTDVDEFIFLIANSKGDPALLLAAMMRCETSRIVCRVEKVQKLAETRFAQVLQEDPDVLSGKRQRS